METFFFILSFENLSVKESNIFSNISSDTEWKDVRGEGQISLQRAKTKSLFRLSVAILKNAELQSIWKVNLQ